MSLPLGLPAPLVNTQDVGLRYVANLPDSNIIKSGKKYIIQGEHASKNVQKVQITYIAKDTKKGLVPLYKNVDFSPNHMISPDAIENMQDLFELVGKKCQTSALFKKGKVQFLQLQKGMDVVFRKADSKGVLNVSTSILDRLKFMFKTVNLLKNL